MVDTTNDVPVVSTSDAAAQATSDRRYKRQKVARTALTLREKSIVKSFCEQKLIDCKDRGQSAPSQEVLRQEIVSQFGWSCGRSTLSKIIAMDWKLLRGSHEGGEAPRNSNMKRRRRPLFPAFEADLVKFIRAHADDGDRTDNIVGVATEIASDDTEGATNVGVLSTRTDEDRRRPLTEALILAEAQRLKHVHGISDNMLVLSVGWLARFKHRHCIRLRKSTRAANKTTVTSTVCESISDWNDGLSPASQADFEQLAPRHHVGISDHEGLLSSSSQPQNTLTIESASSMNEAPMTLCSAQWFEKGRMKASSKTLAFYNQIPKSIRDLGCVCQEFDDFVGAIEGLHVAVVGLGSVADAFLLAQAVGANGFVTCIETSSSNVFAAERIARSFCLRTLGLSSVNMKFIVGDYSNVDSQSALTLLGHELLTLRGHIDIVHCNCSIRSSNFLSDKHDFLKTAFSLLKVGGELRVTDLVCTRRLSMSEKEDAGSTNDIKAKALCTLESSIQTQQKVVLAAPYIGDLQRLFRNLDSNADLRVRSCSKAGTVTIDSAIAHMFPTFTSSCTRFRRATFRTFRLENVKEPCEDYGQTAVFNGSKVNDTTDESTVVSDSFRLDDTWNFESGVRTPVDGNTAQILQSTWMQRYFSVSGDRSRHRGIFANEVHATSTTLPAVESAWTLTSSGITTVANQSSLTVSSALTEPSVIANI
ncbi:putative HTH CenpB-type DNA-binding domain, Methyltransferase domain-containing protein [Plasmopara halstedii]